MDIAAAVGAERLREIMTDLVDRSAAVVKRYGGTVDKFTGDGIMAVFGAPYCVGGSRHSRSVWRRWASSKTPGWPLRSKTATVSTSGCEWGLNSGQVIAGEIGSGPFGYTAVGEQVGIAQRMESVAPAGWGDARANRPLTWCRTQRC